jgi:hypothetical protein
LSHAVTSDNGYHLGEHRLVFGKSHPYDTDIRLPFYIAGPGVPKGEIRLHQTTHLDITATVVDLAGAKITAPTDDLDGLSFASALRENGPSPSAWRGFSFTEFFSGNNTWWNVRVVNATHAFTFHWWCTGQAEVFDLKTDQFQVRYCRVGCATGADLIFAPLPPLSSDTTMPVQMTNLAGLTDFGRRVQSEYLPLASALARCTGASCNRPQVVQPSATPLECYQVAHAVDAPAVSL